MSNDLLLNWDGSWLNYIFRLCPDFTLLLTPHTAGLDYIPTVFISVLLLVALLTFIWFLHHLWRTIQNINYMQTQLDVLSDSDNAAKRRQLQKIFGRGQKKFSGICQAWQDFDQTLVASRDGKQLYSTIPADQFFSIYRIVPKITENRLLNAVPSVLLSIGILGTFVGLTYGLMGIEIGADANVAALRTGIGSMIEGASIAFKTSIWGVFLSVSLNILVRLGEGLIHHRLRKLQNDVNQLFPNITAEGALAEIADDSHESRMALQTLHEKIGEKLQEQMYAVGNRLQESLVQGVQEVMGESLDRLNTQASQQSTGALESLVRQFMERMGETGAEQRRMLDEASDTMQNTVNKLNVQMSNMMDRLSEQQVEADRRERERQQALSGGIEQIGQAQAQTDAYLVRIAKQQNEHTERLEQTSQGLLAELHKASEAIERSSEQLSSGAGSLEGIVDNLKQTSSTLSGPVRDMTDRFASLAQEMERIEKNVGIHIQALDEMQQKADKASEQIGNSAELANKGFQELRDHQEKFLKDLKQNLESAHQNLGAQVEAFAKKMKKWLEDYAGQVSKQTETRMLEWDKQTRNFVDNMQRAVNAINQVVDEIEWKLSDYGDR